MKPISDAMRFAYSAASLDPLETLQRQLAELTEVVTAMIEGGIEEAAAR